MLDKDTFVIEKFARSVTPLPIERENSGVGNMMLWGDNNLYPNFLLELYETVPLHQSIINSKGDYLVGDGLIDMASGDPVEAQISASDTVTGLVQKVVFDWNIFYAFALAVQYNIFGKPISVYHVPFNHIRSNRSRTKFWVCDDWLYKSGQQLSYDVFKLGVKTKQTKLFVYTGYVPSANNTYPSIRYKSAITNMVIEKLVNDFLKGDLEDGFSAAHIISFFKGMPDTEAGKLFTQKVKEAYSGVRGAKYIIDFNNPNTTNNIKVETIDAPDYAGKITSINTKNETNILSAHQAPSRALFGIEQAAGLNGNDLENAYQIFKKVWVTNNRNSVEDGLNIIFGALGIPKVGFKDSGTVLQKTLDKSTMEKVYTIDELRKVDGLQPLPNGEGDKLVPIERAGSIPSTLLPGQDPVPSVPTPPPAKPAKAAFSQFGTGYQDKPKGKKLTEADFELVKDMGVARAEFSVLVEADFAIQSQEDFRRVELLFDDAADVEQWLTDNDISGMSTAEIRAAIKKDLSISLTSKELETRIQALKDAGVLPDDSADTQGDEPAPKGTATRDVRTVYEYDVRPGYGAAIIPGSRGFCRKLIGNDRYYSREDIQSMSAIFGYDVFTHAGGWYYNPDTQEAEDQCRHYFKSVRVIKK
jgi:hypothetical protein